jgi:hypothetical protein
MNRRTHLALLAVALGAAGCAESRMCGDPFSGIARPFPRPVRPASLLVDGGPDAGDVAARATVASWRAAQAQ